MKTVEHATQLSPDGWILSPDLCPRIVDAKDKSVLLALNLNCGGREVLLYNYNLQGVPTKLLKRCWFSVANIYRERSREFYARSLQNIKNAIGKGISSYEKHNVDTVSIFGRPLSEYKDLPEHGPNDLWIGVNWAFKDLSGFDFCLCNSLTPLPPNKSRAARPTLLASVLIHPSIAERWPSMVLYYIPAMLEHVNVDSSAIIGRIYDPGDSGVAALLWASRMNPQKFMFYDVDVSRDISTPGSFEISNKRYAFMGQGLNLAFWSAALYFLRTEEIDFEVVSGWKPEHILQA